jgi:hypothetical protein
MRSIAETVDKRLQHPQQDRLTGQGRKDFIRAGHPLAFPRSDNNYPDFGLISFYHLTDSFPTALSLPYLAQAWKQARLIFTKLIVTHRNYLYNRRKASE